jgi:hypothetical protein
LDDLAAGISAGVSALPLTFGSAFAIAVPLVRADDIDVHHYVIIGKKCCAGYAEKKGKEGVSLVYLLYSGTGALRRANFGSLRRAKGGFDNVAIMSIKQ